MMQPLIPWHWRSLPLNQRTGTEVFEALYIDPQRAMPRGAIATLLESPYRSESAISLSFSTPHISQVRYSICAGAPRVINGVSQQWTPSMGAHLSALQTLLERSPASVSSIANNNHLPEHLPFTGGWLGWLGYDVVWEIEHLPQHNSDPLPFPVSFWYEPDTFAVLDHQEQVLWLAATAVSDLDSLQARLTSPFSAAPLDRFIAPVADASSPLTFLTHQHDYQAAVQQAKRHIQAGDIFQANLSLRFSSQTTATSWSIYRALQQVNPSPFASYWHTPWGAVVSCSPERLVKIQGYAVGDGVKYRAETRPIAGTRPRGKTDAEDRQYAQELSANTKENAEHIMLVDLERNDLGRVCEWGSVNVDELLTIERYSHVMHLVSNVVGTLTPQVSAVDAIRALFPGGTITGCPKVRCMEIIEALEPVRRSLFYGSCGYLDRRGNIDLNILIRTLLCPKPPVDGDVPHTIWGQVGAGIVADSDPEQEWVESLTKAKAQLNALALAEQL